MVCGVLLVMGGGRKRVVLCRWIKRHASSHVWRSVCAKWNLRSQTRVGSNRSIVSVREVRLRERGIASRMLRVRWLCMRRRRGLLQVGRLRELWVGQTPDLSHKERLALLHDMRQVPSIRLLLHHLLLLLLVDGGELLFAGAWRYLHRSHVHLWAADILG